MHCNILKHDIFCISGASLHMNNTYVKCELYACNVRIFFIIKNIFLHAFLILQIIIYIYTSSFSHLYYRFFFFFFCLAFKTVKSDEIKSSWMMCCPIINSLCPPTAHPQSLEAQVRMHNSIKYTFDGHDLVKKTNKCTCILKFNVKILIN